MRTQRKTIQETSVWKIEVLKNQQERGVVGPIRPKGDGELKWQSVAKVGDVRNQCSFRSMKGPGSVSRKK